MAEHDEEKAVESYSVGYGKPPVNSRFKKGQSGNPTGRPKGTPNLSTVLMNTLSERVVVNEKGKRRTISKLQAVVKQLVNKAASGDLRAASQVTALTSNAEQNAEQSARPQALLNELDKKSILDLLNRCQHSKKDKE